MKTYIPQISNGAPITEPKTTLVILAAVPVYHTLATSLLVLRSYVHNSASMYHKKSTEFSLDVLEYS